MNLGGPQAEVLALVVQLPIGIARVCQFYVVITEVVQIVWDGPSPVEALLYYLESWTDQFRSYFFVRRYCLS